MSEQETLFPQRRRSKVHRSTRKAHQALIFTKGPTGCLVCKGSIEGDGGPPTEELIHRSISDRGWTLERIELKGDDSNYPYFVHVVCHG